MQQFKSKSKNNKFNMTVNPLDGEFAEKNLQKLKNQLNEADLRTRRLKQIKHRMEEVIYYGRYNGVRDDDDLL